MSAPSAPPGPSLWRWLAGNWMLAGLALAILVAWCVPAIGRRGGPLHPEWSLQLAVGLSFLVSGLTLPLRQLATAIGRVRLHLFIQGFCFVLVPALVIAATPLLATLGLPEPARQGLLVLACLPTTIASAAILSRAAGGNEAAALFNCAFGNLLGVAATPGLLLLLAGRSAALPLGAVLVQLAEQVLLPLAVGQLTQWLVGGLPSRLRAALRPLPNLSIVFIVYAVFCATFTSDSALSASTVAGVAAIVVALHGALLGLCWWLASLAFLGFSRADRVSALYCSTQKTLSLGAPLIAILFQLSPDLGLLTLPIVLYHPLQILVGGLLVPRLKAWAIGPGL